MRVGKEAPEFKDILGWFNTNKINLNDYRGNVVFLNFWDHACLRSIRGLEFTKRLWERYLGEKFCVIGVHSPEFEFERYLENVAESLKKYGIYFPVAQDNNNSTWLLYGNRYIPKYFIISADGVILSQHIGPGNEYKIEKMIRSELDLKDIELPKPTWDEKSIKLPLTDDISPEIYLGTKEIMSVKKHHRYELAHELNYEDPGIYEPNKIYLNGRWKQFEECIENENTTSDYLILEFKARSVFSVLSSFKDGIKIKVLLNDRPLRSDQAGADIFWDARGMSYVIVKFSGLYNLVLIDKMENHRLKLIPEDSGLQIYSFSFE